MHRSGVVLVLLLAATACAGSPDESGSTTVPASPTPSPFVQVHTGPVGLTAGDDDSVWVVGARSDTVVRIPAGATEPDLAVDVAGTPLRATAAYGSVWVTSFEGRRLVRIDAETGAVVASLRTGAGPEGVAAGFGSVWVVAQDAGKLLRVDPATDTVRSALPLEAGARLVAAGPDAMYVAHYADDAVLRIDPDTEKLTSSGDVCDGPQAMAVLDGRVWVTCTLSDELVALDATTLSKVVSVPIEGSPDSVAVTADGRLAVVAEQGPTLVMVDPETTAVTTSTVLGTERALGDRANLDLALTGGPELQEAWVGSFNADRVYHVPLPG